MAHMFGFWRECVIPRYWREGKGWPKLEVHDIWGEVFDGFSGV